jgi:hypothetical protein
VFGKAVRVGITQKEYDDEVLASILIDASNSLFRERLRPPNGDDVEWLRWRDRFVAAYIPAANQLMPMASVTYRSAPVGIECELVVDLPPLLLKPMVTRFLRDLVGAAKESDLEPPPAWESSAEEDGIREVTEHVAKMWVWAGF